MVTSLAGQSIESLSPAEVPVLANSQVLEAHILCVSDAATKGDGNVAKYRLAAMSISYQPGAIMTLEPFTVTRVSLLLTWEDTSLCVGLKGEVQCGSVPIDISLRYDRAKPDRLDFGMEPRKGKLLRISDVSALPQSGGHHLPPPTYTVPEGVCQFDDDLPMSGIHGVFGLKSAVSSTSSGSPASSAARLLELDADVIWEEVLPILKLLAIMDMDGSSSKVLELHEFRLHWKYLHDPEKGTKASTGHVSALLRIRRVTSSEIAQGGGEIGTDIRLQFEEDATGQEIFSGKLLIPANANEKAFDYKDVLMQLVPSHTYKMPLRINLPETILFLISGLGWYGASLSRLLR